MAHTDFPNGLNSVEPGRFKISLVTRGKLQVAVLSSLLAIYLGSSYERAAATEPRNLTFDIDAASGGDPISFKNWLKELRAALRKNDKQSVAKFLSFPFEVNEGSEPDPYTGVESSTHHSSYTKKTFLNSYDRIFTRSTREYIIKAPDCEFWSRDREIGLGNGGIWFSAQGKGSYKISVINDSVIPPSIDDLMSQIKRAQNSGTIAQLANLNSALGHACEANWRCLHANESTTLKTNFKLKGTESYRKAISLRTGQLAESVEQAADFRSLADNLCLKETTTGQAEDYYIRALSIQRKTLPPQSPALSSTVKTLKDYYEDMPAKRVALLESDLPREEAAIKWKEKQFGSKPNRNQLRELISDYMNLGQSCADVGHKENSKVAYKKAYYLWKKLRPSDENIACGLLEPLIEQNMIAQAQSINANLNDHWFRSIGNKNLVFALARNNRIAESDALLNSVLKELEQSSYRADMADYIEVYVIEKRLTKALALAESAISMCGEESAILVAQMEKGKVEELLGHNDKAEKAYREALDGIKEDNKLAPKLRLILAQLYVKEKKFSKAKALADELAARLNRSGKPTATLGDAISVQAKCMAVESPKDAEKYFQKAIEIKTRAQGAKDKSVRELMEAYRSFSASHS